MEPFLAGCRPGARTAGERIGITIFLAGKSRRLYKTPIPAEFILSNPKGGDGVCGVYPEFTEGLRTVVPFGKLRASCAHCDIFFVTLSQSKGEPVEGRLASKRFERPATAD